MTKGNGASELFIPGLTRRPKKSTVFKDLDDESTKFHTALFPSNLKEQKDRFMRYGLSPNFQYAKGYEAMRKAGTKERYQIKTNLYHEAKAILDKVIDVHGNGTSYADAAFGQKICQGEANDYIQQYILAHDLDGCMTVYWSPTLVASGKMMWVGPSQKFNRPELRRYSFVIKNASDNQYLSEDGIRCLVNHEIGTHYVRFCNDGYQPWYSDRKKFGLRPQSSRKMTGTEEGLATINTLLSARSKYLWGAAVLYYVACKGAEMSFRQLYDHMAQYIPDKDIRWRQVVRVKRGVQDITKPGGYGHDQVYFEGAVEILRNIDQIDFMVLHSGRICWDEVNRVKRLARMDYLKVPLFLKDLEKYKRMLKHIAYINGLGERPPKPPKPVTLKSASKFNMKIYQELPSKPRIEPNLPPLFNFNFKDSPVDFQFIHLDNDSDNDSDSTYGRCFIYPSDVTILQKKKQEQKNQIGLKTSLADSDGQESCISETRSLSFRSHNDRGYNNMGRNRLLYHRPTSSPKNIAQTYNFGNYGRVTKSRMERC